MSNSANDTPNVSDDQVPAKDIYPQDLVYFPTFNKFCEVNTIKLHEGLLHIDTDQGVMARAPNELLTVKVRPDPGGKIKLFGMKIVLDNNVPDGEIRMITPGRAQLKVWPGGRSELHLIEAPKVAVIKNVRRAAASNGDGEARDE